MSDAARRIVRQGERRVLHAEPARRHGRATVEAKRRRLAPRPDHLDVSEGSVAKAERATSRELRREANGKTLDTARATGGVLALAVREQPLLQPSTMAASRRFEARHVDQTDAHAHDAPRRQAALPRQRARQRARSCAISVTRASSCPSTMMRALGSVPL